MTKVHTSYIFSLYRQITAPLAALNYLYSRFTGTWKPLLYHLVPLYFYTHSHRPVLKYRGLAFLIFPLGFWGIFIIPSALFRLFLSITSPRTCAIATSCALVRFAFTRFTLTASCSEYFRLVLCFRSARPFHADNFKID